MFQRERPVTTGQAPKERGNIFRRLIAEPEIEYTVLDAKDWLAEHCDADDAEVVPFPEPCHVAKHATTVGGHAIRSSGSLWDRAS